ncbi:MAG: bifunctional 2-keto-4-hydroxyglutarate aldolase/2-keto-3-deoxy-6-phosphogluconate aldolase, partial [Finegoldia magna]|nr:bifunctional 2-keto-4-hydroxyglutarate aldolase/2-keto-3-deoxy-6-phosphogluconate aldolase [Finegoldia magna]
MKKVEVLKRLENAGVIAVLRADSKEEALKISHAVVEGGMIGLELTFTVPQADEVIRSLVETYHDEKDIVIGAGTVLDAVT